MTALNIARPATVSLSKIKENYRQFLYYEKIDGIYVPCWSWDERNYYTRADGCKCSLGDGLLNLIECELDRHFTNQLDEARENFIACAPAQIRDYVNYLERYGAASLSNFLDGDDSVINFNEESLDKLPDHILQWIITASKAIIKFRDAMDAAVEWEEYSTGSRGYMWHNYYWEYKASDEILAIVRSRCEEIFAKREKERKRKEREVRAAKPLTSRPFTILAHLIA